MTDGKVEPCDSCDGSNPECKMCGGEGKVLVRQVGATEFYDELRKGAGESAPTLGAIIGLVTGSNALLYRAALDAAKEVAPEPCSWCHGDGFQGTNICTECKGTGWLP